MLSSHTYLMSRMISLLEDVRFSQQWLWRVTIFWVIVICSPLKVNRRFGGTYRLHLQRMETTYSSAVFQRTTCPYIPEDSTLLSWGFHTESLEIVLVSSDTCHMCRIATYHSWCIHRNKIRWRTKIMKLFTVSFCPSSRYFSFVRTKCFHYR
jgi:hypothetical protein